MEKLRGLDALRDLSIRLQQETFRPDKNRIRVCTGTACAASGSDKVIAAIEKAAADKGLDLEVVKTGCQGLCQKGPLMKVEPSGFFYQRVREDDGSAIVAGTISTGAPVTHLLYRDSTSPEPYETIDALPFYRKQHRIALRNNGMIDPRNIVHYLAVGGYRALEKALRTMTPDDVLN